MEEIIDLDLDSPEEGKTNSLYELVKERQKSPDLQQIPTSLNLWFFDHEVLYVA